MSGRASREPAEAPTVSRDLAEAPTGWEQALEPLDRRSFLRLGAGLAASAAAPLGCSGVPSHLRPPPDLELHALSPRGYATFSAAAIRLVGPRGGVAIAAGQIQPARTADAWLARTPGLAAALGQGLGLLEFGFFPLLPKLRPFSALPGPAADRVLQSLMGSRLDLKRDLFRGLKSLALLSFYGDSSSHAGIGYPGPFGGAGVSVADAMNYVPFSRPETRPTRVSPRREPRP